MTKDEKYAKALEALKYIATGRCEQVGDEEKYAAKVYAGLTEPQYEEVEVKVWKCAKCGTYYETKIKSCGAEQYGRNLACLGTVFIELTGIDRRPIPEQEEVVWEGKAFEYGDGYITVANLPIDWKGKTVIVRLKGE